MLSKAMIDSFESRVIKSEDPDACWSMRRGRNHRGGDLSSACRYEFVAVGGERMSAHRLSWELVNGPIADGLLIRHRCDNSMCVNPAHLETGTSQDNVQDAIDRNRLNPSKAWAPDGYLSLGDAAQLLGVGKRRLQILCKQGRVVGAQLMLGRIWVIPENVQLTAGARGPKLRAADNVVKNSS